MRCTADCSVMIHVYSAPREDCVQLSASTDLQCCLGRLSHPLRADEYAAAIYRQSQSDWPSYRCPLYWGNKLNILLLLPTWCCASKGVICHHVSVFLSHASIVSEWLNCKQAPGKWLLRQTYWNHISVVGSMHTTGVVRSDAMPILLWRGADIHSTLLHVVLILLYCYTIIIIMVFKNIIVIICF